MTINTQFLSRKSARSSTKSRAIAQSTISHSYRYKRVFDIIFSATVLIICFPIYFTIALLILISSPGPIFYYQERVGKNFQTFKCIKFRTMVKNADLILDKILAECPHKKAEFENNFKLKKDPRITWIGRFLRATSLDEFPQFWNVLKGDMSIVGPRPLVPKELCMYGNKIDKVLTIKPGITGLWQVSGRNDIPYNRRILMDVYYVMNNNFMFDIWIVLKTIAVMFFTKNNGAY
ncbi:sugar transferase [Cyanobacterium stanieri LEGE 03274]|uniref:Sugar transferase n=1 Tax=Cyanobacterium stanieri LEGE 03274 TaxID=1828756 RepID=A0ABR9V0Q9_9CHRO|nr:sugar transferase [Cyanobacterium stanieri]MBE9221474.1 sugar transferase [Cyanobacterium stanieri LEGE 03274]